MGAILDMVAIDDEYCTSVTASNNKLVGCHHIALVAAAVSGANAS